MRLSTAAVEAEFAALKCAAERAGTALACLFSTADEYEAELIRERRAAGRYAQPGRARLWARRMGLALVLGCALLLL